MTPDDRRFLDAAIEEARAGLAAGGIPIGSVLVVDGEIVGDPQERGRMPLAARQCGQKCGAERAHGPSGFGINFHKENIHGASLTHGRPQV